MKYLKIDIDKFKLLLLERKIRGYTLARKLDIDNGQMSKMLNKLQNMSMEAWYKICKYLKLNIETGEPLKEDVYEILNNYSKEAITEAYNQLPFYKGQS